MHRATHSASASTPSSSSNPRKKRFTRDQLLKSLEILGPLGALLPPDLPPSPPASRSSSPAPGSKRRLPSDIEQSPSKKQKASAVSDAPHVPKSHPRPSSSQQAPTEDGEVTEEPPASLKPMLIASSNVPIRRPRRGRLGQEYFNHLHRTYMAWGKILKYSGEKRMASMHPPSHKDYVALPNPPHPNSPYHKYGHLMARLEIVDGLVDFTYAMWSKEYLQKTCSSYTWFTISSFLAYCKHQWSPEDLDEREKALHGLIWMIEGAVHARTVYYDARRIKSENNALLASLERRRAEVEAKEALAAASGYPNHSLATPPMLPSPASITSANSANSTPTNRPSGTPVPQSSGSSGTAPPVRPSQPPPVQHPTSLYDTLNMPPPQYTTEVNSRHLWERKFQCDNLHAAGYAFEASQRSLTLPILAKHYPQTFARMMYSSLSATDESEPEIEDEEGELFWPGQTITGEGLGWICAMGKAMIKEFGRDYGYKGLDAVIPKPKDGEEAESTPQPEPPTVPR